MQLITSLGFMKIYADILILLPSIKITLKHFKYLSKNRFFSINISKNNETYLQSKSLINIAHFFEGNIL